MADFGICAAPGCDKPARQNKYSACSMHEARMRRGGSFDRRQERLTIDELLSGRDRIGSWTIEGEGEPYHRPTTDGSAHPGGVQRTARCKCDCGTTRLVAIHTLKQGHSNHCGCRNGEKNADLHGTHGLSRSPEWGVWSRMKDRCLNPKNKAWHNYGGRGIQVCDRWLAEFEAFYEDMGPRPSVAYSLERSDVNGNYEPSNCVWATSDVQAVNRRNNRYVIFRGQKMALMEACRQAGVEQAYKRIYKRIRRGMPLIDVMAAEGVSA